MDEREKQIRKNLKENFPLYAERCLKIRTKDGKIEQFRLNKAQKFIHAQIEEQRKRTGKVRAVILKGRQQGCSTYVGARFYHKTTHHRGYQTFILTHALDATQNLYSMVKRYHEYCHEAVRPSASTSNSKELIFGGLDSGYKVGTAENKAVGRSSTIQLFHGSEVAFWSNAEEHAKGIMQAVPDSLETEIILESTANGIGNYFHQIYQIADTGLSDFIAIFVPWYWQEEYKRDVPENFKPTEEEENLKALYYLNDEQISWRRQKIIDLSVGGINGLKAFKQEYPNNSTEAFQESGENCFIDPEIVIKARKSTAEAYGPLIIGVDPARYGDDSTAIIRRNGRVAHGLEMYNKKSTMEIVGICHQIIEDEKPEKMFIDIGGIGAGIYDRLIELGHKEIVKAINFGSTPLNQKRFYNKRAEMWGLLKDWIHEEPCHVPDLDSIHSDLCGIRYTFDSNSRLVLEKKEDMRKRGIRSPDAADALALTFAMPVSSLTNAVQNDSIATKIMQKERRLRLLTRTV